MAGSHNLYTKLNEAFMDAAGAAFRLAAYMSGQSRGHLVNWGTTVPADAVAGYPAGALFFHLDGSGALDVLYTNVGTYTSCNFDPVPINLGALATGSIYVGAAGVATALDAKTDKQILVGNGTTLTSVAVSGDATLSNAGALTLDNDMKAVANAIADPGDGLAIVVTKNGHVPLVSAGAETRTIAIPAFDGELLLVVGKTCVGAITVTVASAYTEQGDTTFVLDNQGEFILLAGVDVNGTLAWRAVAASEGVIPSASTLANIIADPGTGVAIPVTHSGICAITTGAGAETNTLAIPTFRGQRLMLCHDVDGGGARTITVATAFTEAGNVTITLDDAGEYIVLEAVVVAAALVWRAISAAPGVYTQSFQDLVNVIADPGTGVAIPVTDSGSVAITTAAAETNTLAIPTFVGQVLSITCDVHAVGDRVITVAAAFNQAGNTTITLDTAGDNIVLVGVQVGGVLVWRVLQNDGCTLG